VRKSSIICFIDDSAFEHFLVEHEIAPVAPDLEFVQAYTFEEAVEKLNGRIPSLFLLDLWGKDEKVSEPYIMPKEELERNMASFPTLNKVYEGLDNFEGDIVNEYLKRLFTTVDNWRSLFEDDCSQVGQNRKYGLSNLKRVRLHYPWIPAVVYTRKSLISDAVAVFRAGADGMFLKPTGIDDTQTRRLTREYSPRLIAELKRIMHRGPRQKKPIMVCLDKAIFDA